MARGKALIVGIDKYPDLNDLHGCVNDAKNVKTVLDRNGDGSVNFDVKIITSDECHITKHVLKDNLSKLCDNKTDIVIFYFAGHGYADKNGGYIITSECKRGDDGLSMDEISKIVDRSESRNKIVILDCCHAGNMGENCLFGNKSIISSGTTYLTSCRKDEYAIEDDGSGLFTNLLVDGLSGGASNILGQISPGSIYSYIDQSLSMWQQRPVFKTNVEEFVCIRNVIPPIDLDSLRQITNLFEKPLERIKLNPTFEFTSEEAMEENVLKMKILQRMERVGLVIPSKYDHMYEVAMNSDFCELTALGRHYWKLVKLGRI